MASQLLPLLAAALPLLHEKGVVAPVGLDLAVVDGQHGGDRLVEERQVVADDQQRPLVGAQVLDQPRLGVEVEVVGRLVEEEDIGLGVEDPRQLHPAPLAARHGHHRLVELSFPDSQGSCDALGLRLGGEPTPGLELVVEAGEPPDGLVALGPGRRLDLTANLLHPPQHRPDLAGGEDALEGGDFPVLQVGGLRLLGEIAHLAGDGDRAGGGRVEAHEGLHEGGLARSVATHEPDLVPRLQAERDPVQQRDGADVDAEVLDDEHGVPRLRRDRPGPQPVLDQRPANRSPSSTTSTDECTR